MMWRECAFSELTVHELYKVLRLRTQVFVVEQQCVFQDMDGMDQRARHLLGTTGGELVAYARLFGPGECFEQASIGRVVTAQSSRGTGVGRQLMHEAISSVERHWSRVPIRIGAQCYLKRFYESFGFERDGDDYVEDGIPHLHMLRPAS
jgi:ElaA protein